MSSRRYFAAGLLLAGCTQKSPQPREALQPVAAARLDEVLRSGVESGRLPGVVVVVATADRVAYRGAAGMRPDAIVDIASMTKALTSTAVMQLVEAGKVKLDEPASTYVPELVGVRVLDKGALRAPRSPATVRQLLTHTSGFASSSLDRELREYVAKAKLSLENEGFMKTPLVSDPGTRWAYGLSTEWLGQLVERVSGQSLDAYMRQALFEPLGMADTYFDVPPEKRARMAASFSRAGDGSLVLDAAEPYQTVTYFSGAAGLYSTADDYTKFVRAILGGGRLGSARILSSASVDQMAENQIGTLSLPPPEVQRPGTRATMPGGADKFGLGFGLNSLPVENGRAAHTLSWAGALNSFFWIDRENGVGAVFVTQVHPFLDVGATQVVDEFEKAVYTWRHSGGGALKLPRSSLAGPPP